MPLSISRKTVSKVKPLKRETFLLEKLPKRNAFLAKLSETYEAKRSITLFCGIAKRSETVSVLLSFASKRNFVSVSLSFASKRNFLKSEIGTP